MGLKRLVEYDEARKEIVDSIRKQVFFNGYEDGPGKIKEVLLNGVAHKNVLCCDTSMDYAVLFDGLEGGNPKTSLFNGRVEVILEEDYAKNFLLKK